MKLSEGSGIGLTLLPAGCCYFKLNHCNRCQATEHPQLLFPVWSESNHRMTSMGRWLLCKVPPTVTRLKMEVFPPMNWENRMTPRTQPAQASQSKRQKAETIIRFWCQKLSSRAGLPHDSPQLPPTVHLLLSSVTQPHTAGFICSRTAWGTLPHAWPHPVIWLNEQSCLTNHSVRGMTG